jgi:hypothetical protein
MMKPKSCPIWACLLLLVIAASCHKTDLSPDLADQFKANANLVAIHLTGRITDDLADPVQGALVRSGTSTTQSDINGNFSFPDLLVNASAALIEVNKNGFFTAFRSLQVQPNTAHFAEISLKQQNDLTRFSASGGKTITMQNGAQLSFEAGVFADKMSGQAYSGEVQAASFALSSDHTAFFNHLPTIKGYDLDKKDVVISPLSLLTATITGAAGEQLQVAKGKTMDIQFPIGEDELANAPQTIAVWHYDEQAGVWMEQGRATKAGSFYTASVNRLSLWACATAARPIQVQANIADHAGNGYAYAKFQLFNDAGKLLGPACRADGNGYINIPAPANRSMVCKIINDCGEVVLSKRLDAANDLLWLGKMETSLTNHTTVVTGLVENCKSSTLFNGHVNITVNGRLYRGAIHAGKFSVSVNRCSDEPATATMVATDDAGLQESVATQFAISTANNNLGQISTCDLRNMQYVRYNINGTNYLLQAPTDSLVQSATALPNKTVILCYNNANKTKPAFTFTFSGVPQPGQYPVTALSINQDKLAFTPSGNIAVEITNYGDFGAFITGKCTGQVKSPAFSQVLPFSFNFKVLRTY